VGRLEVSNRILKKKPSQRVHSKETRQDKIIHHVHKIRAPCFWVCDALHGAVSACFGMRHKKPPPEDVL